MSCMRLTCLVLAGMFAVMTPAHAEGLEYRFSLVDEAFVNVINQKTPLNFQNAVLLQADRGNLITSNLFLGAGVFSVLLNGSMTTSNIQSPIYKATLRECALDWSVSDALDITVGKKILKWGTGYAFNPTGVVEPQRSPSDPSDRLGQYQGSQLVSINVFAGKSSLTFVYVNNSQVVEWNLQRGTQEFALRAYTLLSGLDLSLVGHYREGDRLELGTNWSYVIGENLELHGEFLGKRGSSALYHAATMTDDFRQIYSSYPYTAPYDNSSQVFYRLLLGGQYTFENGLNVVLEYYRNTEGLSTAEWKRWMKFVTFQSDIQRGLIAAAPREASRLNLLWALQTLSPRGTMQDYGFAREYYGFDRWGIELIEFVNLQDFSAVIVPTVSLKISDNLSTYGRAALFTGTGDSEFGALFEKATFNLGLQVQL